MLDARKRTERRNEMAAGRWLVAILASVMLAMSACSKSNPQPTPKPPSQAAPSPSSAGQKEVAIKLQQWSITPTSTTVPAGAITFSVTNAGTIPHEFVVLSTDALAADFPIGTFEGEPNRIDEDRVGTNVGETGDMQPKATKSITIDLKPGHYAFVCNLPAHYGLGMHVDFTVT
jgi:uncharacterized cupredoxin-like copper-binding protein